MGTVHQGMMNNTLIFVLTISQKLVVPYMNAITDLQGLAATRIIDLPQRIVKIIF